MASGMIAEALQILGHGEQRVEALWIELTLGELEMFHV
jgi:hypothetical protein